MAVIASIVLSITTARRLVAQLEKLRAAALELADERLPGVVERLAHGEKVDVAKEAPPLEFGDDVIGQVGQAFNAVQETAIRTAVEEAELRQSIRDILLSLARRTQSLVHRQLTLLDVMERRETNAEELKDLFRVDHLADPHAPQRREPHRALRRHPGPRLAPGRADGRRGARRARRGRRLHTA